MNTILPFYDNTNYPKMKRSLNPSPVFRGVLINPEKFQKRGFFSRVVDSFAGLMTRKYNAEKYLKSIYPDTMNKEEIKVLAKAYKEKPLLTESLARQTCKSNNGFSKWPAFSVEEIALVVKYDRQNPKFAGKLAEVLKNKRGFNSLKTEEAEYVANCLKDNPDIVKYYGQDTSEGTYALLKAHEIYPNITRFLFAEEKFSPWEILDLVQNNDLWSTWFDLFGLFPDERPMLSLDTIAKLSPVKVENIPQIHSFIDFINNFNIKINDNNKKIREEVIPELLNEYKAYPLCVRTLLTKGYSVDEIRDICLRNH